MKGTTRIAATVFLLALGVRAGAAPARVRPAQQRLVGYCISLYRHNDSDYDRYSIAARHYFAPMPRRELRAKLGTCLAALRPRTLASFSVAYTLGYFGVDVHQNIDLMRRGAEGVAEEMWPAMEDVYLRHPDDYVLSRILWNVEDGAGEENLDGVCSDLFRRDPVAVLRVTRFPLDLDRVLAGFDEEDDVDLPSINRTFRRLTLNRDPRVARAARFCLWRSRNPNEQAARH